MKNDCFSFIKYCNERLANGNDYCIAHAIINHIENISSLSLEQIAQEASISTASVSRFISKVGFNNFQEFKHELEFFTHEIKMHRLISHTQRFMRTTVENMSESLYVDAIANLRQTKVNLDLDKLKEIIKKLKHSTSVTFIGDSHELNDFYTLQLDMLINDIPSYMVNVYEVEKVFINQMNGSDTLVFLALYDQWFKPELVDLFKSAQAKGITIIAFSQEEDYLKDLVDILYIYGIPGSYNDGYYSLPYLNRLLCEMIYYKF